MTLQRVRQDLPSEAGYGVSVGIFPLGEGTWRWVAVVLVMYCPNCAGGRSPRGCSVDLGAIREPRLQFLLAP